MKEVGLFFSLILLFTSFQMKGQKGYVRYQTFDEYKLKGAGHSNIREPYVLVKKERDTIFVIKSNDKGKTIKYINKGKYWYSESIIKVKEPPVGSLWLLDMSPTVYEKFIYNNIIVEYKYWLNNELERYGSYIYIHTKKKCIELVIQNSDITNYDDPFNEIKELVINYKTVFSLYSPDYHQSRCYYIYEKQIEGNIFSVYEIVGENKRFISSKKMNSLGEFDNNGTLFWW